jgi:alanine-synthesizing transaminase
VAAKRAAGIPLLDLTGANPTQVLPDYPHAEIAKAYGAIPEFTYRPDPFGHPPARAVIASYYSRWGISVSPDRVALTASTSEAYSLLFKLLCNPGDEVLVPAPSYPLFEHLAKLECVAAVPYKLAYDGAWFIDFDDLRRKISPATRALVIVNPNNPTGSYLKSSEATRLIALATEAKFPIVSDEVFAEYQLSTFPGLVKTLSAFDAVLSFSLNGLSKSAGMPQMKVGWMVLNGPPREVEDVRQRLAFILDTYLSVNTPVQYALPRLLDIGSGIRNELNTNIRSNFAAAHGILNGSPAHCLHTEGGWSLIIRLPRILPEDAWMSKLLDEAGVLAQPGYFFDMPSEAYVVVSLITPPDTFHEGIARLRRLL